MTKLTIKVFGTEVDYEGSEEFLEEKVPQLLDAVRKSQNEEVKRTLRDVHEELVQDLAALEGHFTSLCQLHEEAAGRVQALNENLDEWSERIQEMASSSGEASAEALFAATKQMQEMNLSFNLQYLQLQQQMQHQNRQFTLVSNIMKTKHDTAKAAINNVR